MSAADGMLSAPIAASCAWTAFSRASKAPVSARLTTGLAISSSAILPSASSPCRESAVDEGLVLLASAIAGSVAIAPKSCAALQLTHLSLELRVAIGVLADCAGTRRRRIEGIARLVDTRLISRVARSPCRDTHDQVTRCDTKAPGSFGRRGRASDSLRAAGKAPLRRRLEGGRGTRDEDAGFSISCFARGSARRGCSDRLHAARLRREAHDHVKLADGEVVPVTVDVPPGTPLDEIELPGTPVTTRHADDAGAEPSSRRPEPTPAPRPSPAPDADGSRRRVDGSDDERHSKREKARRETRRHEAEPEDEAPDEEAQAPRAHPPAQPRRLAHAPSNPGFMDALPGPSSAHGRAELRDPQVPGADLPAADLPGGRDPVRHPLGDPGGDQRDRDRLRPQPERVLRRRARLDAVHPLHLAGVRRRREQGRQEGPLQPRRRDLRRRALPQGRRLREGRPPRDLRLQPRRLVRRLGACCARA